MPSILAPAAQGIAKIDHYEVSKLESMRSSFQPGMYCPEGKYARLVVNGRLMMSDTSMERRSNIDFVRQAHGSVLVAGLGLGMILHPVLGKEEVERVTVIEKHQDVIDLVAPSLKSPKLEIVAADILTWRPEKGIKYNAIYFDIWPEISTDNLDEITSLHRAFKSRLDRTDAYCWMGSWMHRELKRLRRQDKSRRW